MEQCTEKLITETLEVLKGVNSSEENKIKTLSECQVEEEQSYENKNQKFDRDSSPKAWEYFETLHKLNDIQSKLEEKNGRLVLKYENIYIAGDCSFNFSEKKTSCFEEIIKNDEDLNNKLNICKSMHHNILNFDLMPVTGGLNNLKAHLKYAGDNGVYKISVHDLGCAPGNMHDRLDTFIYFLDYSLKEMKRLKQKQASVKEIGEFLSNSIFTTSIKGENFGMLYDLLDKYDDIYSYCNKFYAIDSISFINRLIESGKKQITDAKSLENYMNLAIDYWILKGETWRKTNANLPSHLD